jgi:uncharacterized protein YjhX (UPF0386 family)
MIYDVPIIKTFLTARIFDEQGRPYRILDDDLEEVLAHSDYAKRLD